LCYHSLGRHEDAIESFNTCIALKPDFAAAWQLRGDSWLHVGKVSEALADLDRALELEPEGMVIRFDRALARLAANDLAGAEADLTALIDARFEQTRVFFVRARVRQQAGNQAGATADRAEGLARPPVTELDAIARAVARLPEEPKAALIELDECLGRFPESRLARENKAHVLTEYLNQPTEALRILNDAVQRHPESALAHSGRGVLLARNGEYDAARSDASRALSLESRPVVWYQVAGIYALTAKQKPADRDRAVFLLQKSIHHDFGLDLIDRDPELDTIRKLPEVQKLMAGAKTWKTAANAGGR
jgi:tetratricopeptide (TPR) repeat protein